MEKVTNNTTKQVVLTNEIIVDGQCIRRAQFSINSDNPVNMGKQQPYTTMAEYESVYKENRVEIRKLEGQFEDEAYALQDQMIAEVGGNSK